MNEFHGILSKPLLAVSSCLPEFECSYGWTGAITKEVYVHSILLYRLSRFVVFEAEGEWHLPVSIIVSVNIHLHYLQKSLIFTGKANIVVFLSVSEDVAFHTLILLGETILNS